MAAMENTAQALVQSIPEGDVQTTSRNTYTTRSGITFRVKPVPPYLMRDATRKHKPPKPPMVRIADKGTSEPNPDDPDFKEAVDEFNTFIGELVNSILLTRGTEIVQPLPAGTPAPESDEWIADIEDTIEDFKVERSPMKRYFCWLKYVALTNMDDYRGLVRAASAAGGVTVEEDVAEATADFRSDPPGNSDNGVSTEPLN